MEETTTEEPTKLCGKCGGIMNLHGFVRKTKYTYPEYVCSECRHVKLDDKERELNHEGQ